MKKLTMILSVMMVFASSAYAVDFLEVEYREDKPAACETILKWYDGDAKKVTCEVVDKDTDRKKHTNIELKCEKGEKIRHLEDGQSAIFISGSCPDESPTKDMKIEIARVRAVNTKGKGKKGKGAKMFAPEEEEVETYLANQADRDKKECYHAINLEDDIWLKVRVNRVHIYQTGSSCKGIYLEDPPQ